MPTIGVQVLPKQYVCVKMFGMKVSLNPMNPNSGNSTKVTSTKKAVGVSVVSCIVVSLIVGAISFAIGTRYSNASGGLDYSKLNEVYSTLKSTYYGDLDDDKLIQGAAAGMASATGDPYTTYFTQSEAQEFSSELSGTFQGVGIELGQNSGKQLEVVTPLDNSPAKTAGIMAHDIIAKVDGEVSINWTPEKAVTKIRGEAGTQVKITVLRNGETKEYSITRAEISVPSVKSEIKDGIGYLRISRFGDDTISLAAKAAKEFKSANVKGVILDLRGNGGGYVSAAVGVASLWLDYGKTIVEEKRGDKVITTETSNGNSTLKGVKTIVLIDGGSASASEIVAGALQDYSAAKLVGEKSYGKGSVQELVSLDSGAQLKITIAKWYTPKGNNIDKNGIKPDIELVMTSSEYEAGNDTQRTKAIEIIEQ